MKVQSFSEDKFKCFVRFMIQAAKQKRCVTYVELENTFGLGHGQVGWYAGMLGDYCQARKMPFLNGLIISSTNCAPSQGFDWYQKEYDTSWGEIVSDSFKYFHVTSSRAKQSEGFGGRDKDVSEFLKINGVPEYLAADE
jgi:hypothetical protein